LAELTIGQLIKIILGIFVFVTVVVGVYFFFNGQVIPFFDNLVGNGSENSDNLNSGAGDSSIINPPKEDSFKEGNCKSCRKSFWDTCTKKECLSLGCQYTPNKILGMKIFGGKCTSK